MTKPPPPQQQEQRGTFRLLSYWQRIRGRRTFPALADINIADIEEMWHMSFTIDVTNPDEHVFQYFGPDLASIFNMDYTGEYLEEAMNDVIVNNTIGSYLQTLDKREPTMEAAAFTYDGKEFRYRTLIVPLSSDDQTIDYLMGTTNYRTF